MGFGEQSFGDSDFGSTDPSLENNRILTDHSNPKDDDSPRDLAVNSRQDIFWASNGDLATVNGRRNIEQSCALEVMHVVDPEIGGTTEPNDIHRVESKIRDVLEEDPQVGTVVDVSVQSYNEDSSQLNFSADVQADDGYEIPITSLQERYTTDEDGETVTYLVSDEKVYEPADSGFTAMGGGSGGGSTDDEGYETAGYGTAYGLSYS